MIFYLLREINKNSITYAEDWGPAPGSRMRLLQYDDLMRTEALELGTYIFTDLDVLSEAQFMIAETAWRHLAASGRGLRLLNNPSRALNRFDLLSTLHVEGINRFRAVRAKDSDVGLRFPVFVRYEKQHTGPLTPLLRNARELKRALRYLRLRGHRLADLLAVEFCNTSNSKGLFRKYAAFLVGDRVLPRHLFFSHDWMIKRGGAMDKAPMNEALNEEKLEYLYGNPHDQWIKQIFRRAGLEFGRLDYSMMGDIPQVWEINSNPTIKNLTPRLTKAFETIDHADRNDAPIPFSLSPSLVRARSRECRRKRLHETALATLDWFTEAPLTRPVVDLAKHMLRFQ
jgi:hypothetical protein